MPVWTVKTPPASLPVTSDQARDHLRLLDNDKRHVARINASIAAATALIEREIDHAIVSRTLVLHLKKFPDDGEPIDLPIAPAISVTSVKYLDVNGTQQTMDASDYVADVASRPGRVGLDQGASWPETRNILGAVTIEFVAGFETVPDDLFAAVQLLTAHFFENPEATSSLKLQAIPMGVDRILDNYRRPRI